MKTIFKVSLLLFFLGVGFYTPSFAQDKPKGDGKYKPLTLKLDESGEKYIRFITWHQMWLQHRSISGESGLRMSIRRSRFLAYAQISPRFLILTHWGLNSLGANQITANPNSQTDNQRSLLFLHDAWAEFAVVDKAFHIGTGLHYWNGISRLSNQSTLNMMTLDNPGMGNADARLFPWSTITTSDQFARHLGVYAKGTVGGFHYRVAANNARINQGAINPDVFTYQVAGDGDNWLLNGYFKYDFFDVESSKLPYFVGTYLGKKQILSVGAGFHYHPNALGKGPVDINGDAILDADGNPTITEKGDVTKFAADIFYDAPVGDGAINVLGAYYNFDYGGEEALGATPGGGLVPASGSIVYGQLGYMLPFEIGDGMRIMPYVTYSSQNLKHTPDNSNEVALGLNWFVNGHFAKITAEYATGKRGTPGAENTEVFTLQTHIFL